MSYFLWIEDFENSVKTTAHDVLGSIIEEPFDSDSRKLKKRLKEQGVFIELTFQDGLIFILDKDKLNQVDYIILDIDLKSHNGSIDDISPDVLELLYKFQDYTKTEYKSKDEESFKKACKDLKEIAGFYLYTHLVVELGFPKTHILFCSNHGENTKTIQDSFKQAKILLPQIYQKSNHEVQVWVKSRYDNPYSRLRRGIIEGCQHLKNLPEEKLRFNNFIQDQDKQITLEDLHNYLDVLENFLPLREPSDKTTFYKLFVRTLVHEWESANPWKSKKSVSQESKQELFAFAWIMKMTRNWSAHSRIFENINEQDVAYLFIVNMRAMFFLNDSLLGYEKHLLQLFEPISVNEIEKKIGNERPLTREIPLEKNYAALLNKANKWEAINFHDALNDLQKDLQKSTNSQDNNYLIRGLYQTFWFLTSNGRVFATPLKDSSTKLNYNFYYFDYAKNKKDNYLFELARHIYKRSFGD